MDETPKQLAERRLREMVSEACDVVRDSIKSPKVARGQQTRSADAWSVINTVLKLGDPAAAKPEQQQHDDGPIADVSEKLRLIKQAERRAR